MARVRGGDADAAAELVRRYERAVRGPVRAAAAREMLAALLDRLDPRERDLAQRRAGGQKWNEIAAELGETPQAVRMRLSRAIDRVSPALGLDDGLDFGD